MKPGLEIAIQNAADDGVPLETYLSWKARLALLNDTDGSFACGREYLVVEVDSQERVRVVDAHESAPQADLSIMGPGGELRKGRSEAADYFVIKSVTNSSVSDPDLSSALLTDQASLAPRISQEIVQAPKSPERRTTFPRSGMIWTPNRRRV